MSQMWEMTAVGTSNAAHCLRSKCYIYAVYLNYNGNFLTAVKHASSLPKPDPSPPSPFLPEQTAPTAKMWLFPRDAAVGPEEPTCGSCMAGALKPQRLVPCGNGIPSIFICFFSRLKKKKNVTRKLFIMIYLKLSLKICQFSCHMVS